MPSNNWRLKLLIFKYFFCVRKDDRPWLGPGLILRLVSYLLEVTPILNFDESKFHLCAQESGLVVVCAHSEGFRGRGNAADVPGHGTRGSVRSLDSSAPSLIYHSKLCEDIFEEYMF